MSWEARENQRKLGGFDYLFTIGAIELTESEVGASIQAMMGMAQPNDLYWALVNAARDLKKFKQDHAEIRRQAERAQAERNAWNDDSHFTVDGEERSQTRREHQARAEQAERNRQAAEDILREAAARMSDDLFKRAFGGGFRFQYGFDPGRDSSSSAFTPPRRSAEKQWWETIGCSPNDNRAAINSAYRKRAMAIHTEKLGDEAMKELNVAKDLAFKLVLV